jgi:hypothetical protein
MFAPSKHFLKKFLRMHVATAAVCALSIASGYIPAAKAQNELIVKLRQDYFNGLFGQVLTEFSQLPADLRDNPQACFFVGQSYLRRRDIEHAEEYLKKAQAGSLALPQKERANDALQRIAVLKQLRPPFFHDYALDGYKIRIYAKDSPWSRDLAKQMPTFLARAKEGFGSANAFVAFYLFEDRAAYDKFFDSWTIEQKNILHRGTGSMQIVMFCRYYPTGKEVGKNDVNDLYFRVLHEYSHALCHTIYGDSFRMPQWLNEGMADYFGWKYKPNGAALALEKLQGMAAKKPARSFENLTNRFHDDNDLGYTLGDVLVSELFAGKPLSIYGKIIDSARSNGGNFDQAVQLQTGQNPRDVYAKLLKVYWKTN